jgi:hypothetical protein
MTSLTCILSLYRFRKLRKGGKNYPDDGLTLWANTPLYVDGRGRCVCTGQGFSGRGWSGPVAKVGARSEVILRDKCRRQHFLNRRNEPNFDLAPYVVRRHLHVSLVLLPFALVADNLQKMGYANVLSMDGGWCDWLGAGYPTAND